jgi:hypothetical protein
MTAFYSLKAKPSTTTSSPEIVRFIKPVRIVSASIAHLKLDDKQRADMAAQVLHALEKARQQISSPQQGKEFRL